MNYPLSVVLAICACSSAVAQGAEFDTVVADQSRLSFVYRQMNVPLDGHFRRFSARLAFDPSRPAAASAALDLDLTSVDAGSPEANDALADKAWFNIKMWPRAQFVSDAVTAVGGNRYEARGKMTIKGRTRELTAPFTMTSDGKRAAFDGAFVLKRADFAIGEGEWADFGVVANEIQIKFHVVAVTGK